jgi:fermentation-respiration switch protein FrsA (DUF1100 family)
VEWAKTLQIPILLIHSKDDRVIPFPHALLLEEALEGNPKAEFWFPDALRHGEMDEEHRTRILDFFTKNL